MPAYNEAASLPDVLARVLLALRALSPRVELVVVDDGSRDDTVAVMRRLCAAEPALRLVQLSRNFGKEAALTAGLAAARGEVVVLMDALASSPSRRLTAGQAATALGVPVTRAQLALGQVAKLINVEGYPVLSIDPATGAVVLDERMLTEQYGLGR